MGDGASSSSNSRGRGETVVHDHGKRRSPCGYCRSPGYTSLSHGLWVHSITVDDYQELLDRGWRRSGSFIYKPDIERTCCPSYTIRLKADDFVPSKEQERVRKKMQRFLDGMVDLKSPDQLKGKPKNLKCIFPCEKSSSRTVFSELPTKWSLTSKNEIPKEDKYLHYLSKKIDDAVNACIRSGDFPSVPLPKAVVKKVTPQAKKKLKEMLEDLLYTSSISFQIAAILRRFQTAERNSCQSEILRNGTSQIGDSSDLSANNVAVLLTCLMDQEAELSGLTIKACNGHINFYSAMGQVDSAAECGGAVSCQQSLEGNGGKAKHSCLSDDNAILPHSRRRLEICLKQSSFDPEEYALYKRYQIKVHEDNPDKVTENSYRRFLVDTPLVFVPPYGTNRTIPPCGFGSFHQQYLIDGKLVAVGVVDILPSCLSSKYLFWDPDLAFLSLGKFSALKEIDWVKETEVHCPSLQYYYMGYYIHSCNKMRYKAAYRPSELLCPLRYEWVAFDMAKPLLDKRPYVILSDYATLQNGGALPFQFGENSNVPPHNDPDGEGPSEYLSDEESEMELDCEGPESGLDDESGTGTSGVSLDDENGGGDVSNIVIDLKGSRQRFKDLERVLGRIPKERLDLLELQLRRYAGVVGAALADRMVYSLQ